MSSGNHTSSFTWFVRVAAVTVVLVTSPVNSFFVGQRPQQQQTGLSSNNNINVFQSSQQNQLLSKSFLEQEATVGVASRSSSNNRRPTFLSSYLDGLSATTAAGGVQLIIAGAPASGKGTQCELIKEQYGVVHLSTGDMLREAVRAQTSVGLLAKEYMDSGKLVPDDVMITIVRDRLQEKDCVECGWLLDGFPRTQEQALALEKLGVIADLFLFLNVPDEILVERVVGRRTDPMTNKIYHLTFSPPPIDDMEIMNRLVHRSDDTEEKVKVRLQQFYANVNAVKDSYTNISVTIDGNQNPKIVSQLIVDAIENSIQMKNQQKVSS